MNKAELSGLRYRVCSRKTPLGRNAAMKIAARARSTGDTLVPYRCPFLDAPGDGEPEAHWHVGHPPAMATLERIAELLRDGREPVEHVAASPLDSTPQAR